MTVAHHPRSHAVGHESAPQSDFILQCPRCSMELGSLPGIGPNLDAVLVCSKCSLRIRSDHGIWRAIPPAREICFERFITEYQVMRQKEGSDTPEYYLSLPCRDTAGRNQSEWTIRAQTFRYFEEKILPKLEQKHPEGMDVLDLGAGNGWLSYRLALRGHRPVAVDLLMDETDGLGAAAHYRAALPSLFPRVQAELDRLPFADSQFDCAIFNASFHYSEDYVQTLQEAIRCLRPGGSVIVCDSPWYKDESSGRAMLEERRAEFIARFGFPSEGMASIEFLTDRMMTRLERRFGIRWQVHTPYYGMDWSLRPLLAKLRGKRNPSRFQIYVAEVKKLPSNLTRAHQRSSLCKPEN